MCEVPYFRVNTFVDSPLSGCPVTVFRLNTERSVGWMQDVAREMRLYKSVFINRVESEFRLRFFTPTVELAVSGSSMLAAAHVLWETQELSKVDPAHFVTQRRNFTAHTNDDQIVVELNVVNETQIEKGHLEDLFDAKIEYAGMGTPDICFAEVDSERRLHSIHPNLQSIQALPYSSLVVTSTSMSEGLDVVSRVFSPRIGIPEDPASAIAHACMASYWSKKLGKSRYSCCQGSDRLGFIGVRLEGDFVHISGNAFKSMAGRLDIQ